MMTLDLNKLIIAMAVCLATAPTVATSAETNDLQTKVEALIQGLGAETHAEREEAEEMLRDQPRSALPILGAHSDLPDPEVRERVRNIIAHIQSDPAKIPQAIWRLDGVSQRSINDFQKTWDAALVNWNKAAVTGEKHTKGNSGRGGRFAQSFKPGCGRIAAVGLYTYPANNGWGWMRVDICKDLGGRPGPYVLARSWLKVEKGFHGSPRVAMLYDIPDVVVDPDGTYWVTFTEFRATGSPSVYLTNHGLSIKGEYDGGKLSQSSASTPSSSDDAKFIIYSQCPLIPALKRLALDALDDIADKKNRFKHWNALPRQ